MYTSSSSSRYVQKPDTYADSDYMSIAGNVSFYVCVGMWIWMCVCVCFCLKRKAFKHIQKKSPFPSGGQTL